MELLAAPATALTFAAAAEAELMAAEPATAAVTVVKFAPVVVAALAAQALVEVAPGAKCQP